jgi:hypothetical protein
MRSRLRVGIANCSIVSPIPPEGGY